MLRASDRIRRQMVCDINGNPRTREELEAEYGQVWDTVQLQQDHDVRGFLAPFVVATRKTDGQLGSLMFQNSPRYYFNWTEYQ